MAKIAHGEIVQIAEILSDVSLQNRSVRITGRLERYDAGQALAVVSFQNCSMVVETQRLSVENLELRIGSMYQFIGETYKKLTATPPEIRLVARVARNVDNLDINLFLQALELRRQFLQRQQHANASTSSSSSSSS